jgi:hypothetical protein
VCVCVYVCIYNVHIHMYIYTVGPSRAQVNYDPSSPVFSPEGSGEAFVGEPEVGAEGQEDVVPGWSDEPASH